jgi:hypothetical protein
VEIFGQADDGSRAHVTVSGEAQQNELERRWPPLGLRRIKQDPAEGPPDLLLTAPDSADTQAWDRVESDLGLFAAERLEGLVAIHAAVLALDDRLIILPGRSHTGKSTIALAMRDAGALLLSDEYALVDPSDGSVMGWPRPARLRLGSHASRREPVTVQQHPMQVELLALLRYDPSLGDDRALDVMVPSRADAVISVLDETVCARSRPDESLDAALRVTARGVVKGRRGEAFRSAHELLSMLRSKVEV